jgi:hypothetical protein
MNWLKRVFGSSNRITVKNPLVIESPKIGFLNLMGAPGQLLLDQDKAALGPIFPSCVVSDDAVPECDVLLVYAQVETDGRIDGSGDGLRDIIRKAKAVIAIVASPNEPNSLIAAGKPTGYGQANLILTIDRKGVAFPSFYTELFGRMRRGVTMPVAWVELAPQIPGARHEHCPDGIFSAEISHIVFR